MDTKSLHLWKTRLLLAQLITHLVSSSKTTSNELTWPEGLYGLPKPVDGCPRTPSTKWESGLLYQDCEDTSPKTSKSSSYHLAGFVTNDVQKEFCIKTSTTNDSTRHPWPSGQYCIYQKGDVCPRGLISGWIVWDDESQIIGGNKNNHSGTLPKGIYNTNTKLYFCCSTNGNKQVAIDLPVFSPFYLIAYRGSLCQSVRGATVAREFIYYETEYYTSVTRNDYGGAHPYQATKSRYGHTIHYCYYTPKYCLPRVNSIHSNVYPPRCTQSNMNVFNDSCSVQCNGGYIPRLGNATRTVCGEDGTWDVDVLTDCIPAQTTVSTIITTSTNLEHHSSTKPSPNHFESTRQNTMTTGKHTKSFTETSHGTSPIRLITDLLPTDGYHHADTQHSGHGGLSSIGRVIAGAICGGVVTFGVFLIVCISHCRKGRVKSNMSTSGLEKSKSLEELVAGRSITMNRTISSENLIYADPFICEVQYSIVKTDDNPLYQSIERPCTERPERITDNVLYESVSPLLLDKSGLNETAGYPS